MLERYENDHDSAAFYKKVIHYWVWIIWHWESDPVIDFNRESYTDHVSDCYICIKFSHDLQKPYAINDPI